MAILINTTFDDVTPESAEHGDSAERGYLAEDESLTFRELVETLRNASEASQWPLKAEDVSPWVWVSTHPYTEDYATGAERIVSYHYSHKNPPRNLKYWRLALVAAGIARR
jgi:hypothetical protein